MYRSGLDSEFDDVAQEFVSSLYSDSEILSFDVAGTEAHVMMLHKSNIISKIDAAKILAVLKDMRDGNITIDSNESVEDCHEFLEKYITEKVGSNIGGKVQTGRSRNDQVATAIKMKLRHDTTTIQMYILQLVKILIGMAKDNKKTIIPLYTHQQHAQVGVLSHYFMAYTDVLIRDFDRFMGLYQRLVTNPLGSGPVGGTNIQINRDMTTKTLAFNGIQENSLDATSNRDYMSEFASCVAIMMSNLSRIAGDFVMWSSSEFSFIEITDGLASPSSIMPQKKNPDILELVRGKAATTIGCLTSVLSIQKGLATGYGRDLQETKDAVWTASGHARGALRVMGITLDNLKINKDRMIKSAEAGHILALDIAEKLVEKNVPFRQAHMEVGALVATARSQNKELIDLTPKEIESVTTIDAKTIGSIFSQCTSQESAYKRHSMGSTSTKEQDRMIQERYKNLERMFSQIESQKDQYASALYEMRNEIDDMIQQAKK